MNRFLNARSDRFPLQSTRYRAFAARPIVEAPLDSKAAQNLESFDLPRDTRPTPVPMRGAVVRPFVGMRVQCCPVGGWK